ncbi:hypothetical protein CBM2615_B160009 [Cupriavidus taiwanensis]|uniref:Uncharacterized protein n=1 Tax=Cupriavidus taiwanensis TaxID=164546 RepID=A0A375E874_9BURK|nr:hypothetical protein CBM2614_B170009 [Cupriavidus taiwanensis]SOZ65526.1 hypothetical protein CBM2615_B160009 [Cupriavidus taiwanensis]SOZ69112.1 hypothetical protein CBM2613_B130009 [Cupriavidus taiwanensis]SPA08363.1 hypothetical protein CBM2625_B130009 [Cupriavidus taiwanensis]
MPAAVASNAPSTGTHPNALTRDTGATPKAALLSIQISPAPHRDWFVSPHPGATPFLSDGAKTLPPGF